MILIKIILKEMKSKVKGKERHIEKEKKKEIGKDQEEIVMKDLIETK